MQKGGPPVEINLESLTRRGEHLSDSVPAACLELGARLRIGPRYGNLEALVAISTAGFFASAFSSTFSCYVGK